ncbi:aspartic proteinase CDR1-like [Elaeis guineensis]|uniref:Aspartic proteinase CDR1-like n=1 Tax=Elaeis guineensis var. tenera TaxID=51953 RepID=A0A6I9QLI6_ELAGV|nr:aspartic proteinase CDR1-like [Elaeis guineensis]
MAFAPLPPSTKSFLFLLFLIVRLPTLSHQQHIRLIHRDSPESPLFDSSATTPDKYWQRVHRRSVAYRDHFQAALEGRLQLLTVPLAAEFDVDAGFDQVGGEYLMEFTIGTPPVKVMGMLDVPGDFIWTQCVPCPNCTPSLGPLYDPSRSSTRSTFSCSSIECLGLQGHKCVGNDTCEYIRTNEYGVQTSGVLTSDVFTINGVAYTNMPFDCGSDNSFSTKPAVARVGLSGSDMFSLVFRFNSGPFAFSHCFRKDWENPSVNTSSDLHLGMDARLKGVSSPLARCRVGKTSQFFAPTLLGLGVGPVALNLTKELVGGDCSTVFTSSTPLTFLKRPLFNLVASKVREQANLPEAPHQPNDPWDLCFNGTENALDLLPPLEISFDGELALALSKAQIYAEVDGGRTCLLMAPTDGVNMFGTYMQMNRNFGYDLSSRDNYRLYFDLNQCD